MRNEDNFFPSQRQQAPWRECDHHQPAARETIMERKESRSKKEHDGWVAKKRNNDPSSILDNAGFFYSLKKRGKINGSSFSFYPWRSTCSRTATQVKRRLSRKWRNTYFSSPSPPALSITWRASSAVLERETQSNSTFSLGIQRERKSLFRCWGNLPQDNNNKKNSLVLITRLISLFILFFNRVEPEHVPSGFFFVSSL